MSYNILQALIIFVIIFKSGISKVMFMSFHCPEGPWVYKRDLKPIPSSSQTTQGDQRKPNSHGAGAGGGASAFFSTLGPPLPPRRLVPPNIHIAKLPGTAGPPALAFLGPREKVSACL